MIDRFRRDRNIFIILNEYNKLFVVVYYIRHTRIINNL